MLSLTRAANGTPHALSRAHHSCTRFLLLLVVRGLGRENAVDTSLRGNFSLPPAYCACANMC